MQLMRILAVAAAVASIGTARVEASPIYWSLFNVEGESSLTAQYVTYASLPDMLVDQNRLGVFDPNTNGVGRNIVGSGSDGAIYWKDRKSVV